MVVIGFAPWQGMNMIEDLSPTAFTAYLKKYGNTICGRHPIGVLLNVSLASLMGISRRWAVSLGPLKGEVRYLAKDSFHVG